MDICRAQLETKSNRMIGAVYYKCAVRLRYELHMLLPINSEVGWGVALSCTVLFIHNVMCFNLFVFSFEEMCFCGPE